MKLKLKRIWQQVTADKKRFGMLCSLLLIALLLWARIIVIARPPRTAVADQVASSAIVPLKHAGNHTISVFLDDSPRKNPFTVNSWAFPEANETSENTPSKGIQGYTSSTAQALNEFQVDAILGDLAMINGKVYQIGDVLLRSSSAIPITITGVEGRTVILSVGDRRYELTIASLQR